MEFVRHEDKNFELGVAKAHGSANSAPSGKQHFRKREL